MLTMKAQYSLTNAEEYFREHLRAGDYYMAGQTVSGQWFGKGAEALGLTGVTLEKDFLNLCRNVHPQSGERLTMRQKTVRMKIDKNGEVREVANRRVFYDFTLSPPKTVSITALVGNDRRIIKAHDEAVTVALLELQAYAASRVRKQGQSSYRKTENLVGAVFRHDTSRALDPHLHSHCILFNATKDSVEGCWKALETFEMLSAKKFTENVYYHELARSLNRFGYAIKNNPRGDFDIEGISPELVKRFSKRHEEIDQKTKELLEREPSKAGRNIKDIREHIAHKERARKIKDVGITKLQSIWNKQLSWREQFQLHRLDKQRPPDVPRITAEQAVSWAEHHLFERRSVVHEHDIWRHALERARGQNFSLWDIQSVTQKRGFIRDKQFQGKITTRETLQRELNIVLLAQHKLGRHEPLAPNYQPANTSLDEEQRHAVEHILSSVDFVTLFRGGAGTGKSFTLREVQTALKQAGHVVHVLAPQRQQVADLERDGFVGAQTVSAFLTRRSMPRGAVILVDEAGQIGGEQMLQLLSLIRENNGRVIFSGDTHQHGAVEVSDALRAIEKYSGLKYAELTNIRRQNPDSAKTQAERRWLEQYKLAVNEAREGKFGASFDRLDKQGAIVSCSLADQQEKLTEHFLELFKNQQSIVVVSQSWSEIHKVNEQVRFGLKTQKLIGETDTPVTALERMDLTDAQKRDKRFYPPDSVLVFNRPVAGFKSGSAGKLRGITDKHLLIEADSRIRRVPFKQLDKITVCQPKELSLSTGDRLQLKANAQCQDGRKLANGELVTVKLIHADGRIALNDGRTLPKDYRQFVRGYAVTSYAAQGKTVDYVLFSDSAVTAATNEQQWYVTISRGRRGVKIFTADKIQLRQNITHSGDRPLALDMTRETSVHKLAQIWGRDVAYVLNVQQSQRKSAKRQAKTLRQRETDEQSQVAKQSESVKTTETVRQAIQKSQTVRRRIEIPPRPTIQKSRGMRI
jgi:conjugative relaxase-like TrwC/TraI family protein